MGRDVKIGKPGLGIDGQIEFHLLVFLAVWSLFSLLEIVLYRELHT